MIIGVDHGYGFIKTRNSIFAAGVACYDAQPPIMDKVLEYEGKYYCVGTSMDGLAGNKTENINYYILTLAAIAEEIKFQDLSPVCNVTLCAGLPLTRFGAEKESFLNYLKQNTQQIEFKYEGKSYKIRIEDVKLFPQGYAAAITRLKGIACNVVDIGTGTTDIVSITSSNIPDMRSAKTIQHGISKCIASVNEEISRAFSSTMQTNQIIDMMIGKEVISNKKALAICQEAISEFANSTLNILRQNNINYELTPTYIMGGGASIIKKYANNLNIDDTCIEIIDDIKANAIGFEILGKNTKSS